MKIKNLCLAAVLLLLSFQSVFGQWTWINPLPTGENIHCVDFVNDNTGYVVTFSFNILKTTDGGNSWALVTKLNLKAPDKLQFLNENTGFVKSRESSNGNKIYKTTDGGNNWFSIANAGQEYIWSFDFPNVNTGYIIATSGINENVLSKTTNGGASWFPLLQRRIQVVEFFDSEHGSIYGLDSSIPLSTTVNGGVNWISNFPATHVRNVSYVNSNLIYAVNGLATVTTVYKSSDSGLSWVLRGEAGSLPYDPLINFINESTGYLIDNVYFGQAFYGPLLRTTNGGINWTGFVESNTKPAPSISFNNNSFYSVGPTGQISKSTDYGVNWERKDNSFINKAKTLYFPDNSTGVIAGDDKVVKTTNGGSSWVNILNLDSIKFAHINSGNGEKLYAACSNGFFARSTNFGSDWSFINTGTGLNFLKTYFINDNTGFLWNYNNPFYRTTDGGNHWNPISSLGNIRDISFADDLTGYAVGTSGNTLLKSTDGGATWFAYNTSLPTFYPLNIIFLNNSTAYLSAQYPYSQVGYKFAIYKTTNEGVTWTEILNRVISSSFASTIFEFKKTAENIFVAQYPDANGLISTDNGNTWNNLTNPNTNINIRYFFPSALTGYIAGDATIAKTTNGGTVFINNINSAVPKDFQLEQNYPNPFNPSTKIKFDISENATNRTSPVKLVIYNSLGAEVSTLVNEILTAGSYEVEFNGNGFPSGVYFYRLRTNSFSETRKMILLK